MTQETTNDATHGAEEGSSDMFNTTAGWVLFAAGLGLGLSIVAGKVFHGDSPQRPDTLGYVIEGVDTGVVAGPVVTIDQVLNGMPQNEQIAAGERVFAKCQACHTVEQGGAAGVGPNLYGIMGAPVGGVSGYSYSPAMAGFGGNWGWEEMNQWLASPRRYVDGTKMSFAGLSSIEDRAAVAMYMNSFGSNLPIPEYVEVAAEESDADVEVEENEAVEAGAAEAEAQQEAAAELEEAGA
ncbi:cytochrome c family protein [uncultured Erythrobacter sp.]|uniref:c-type cytochrome n=1 Tax=uncultured Erythrobacter sp. TaxID=263913 RepID=UPI00261BF002|nr:cytochrome c family protein [uncultured Erythrobacter sp.]